MRKRPSRSDSPPSREADIADETELAAPGVTPEESDARATAEHDDAGDPGAVSAADPVAEQEIQALATEVAKLKDRLLRQQADFDNSKKRLVRERQEAESKGMGYLIKGILDTLDDLGRFAHLDPSTADTKTVVDGVELVERKLLKSLAGHGLELVNPVDAAFDPTYHEALTTVPAASEDEDHLVAQVYQVGYVFNGQLLRPARVVVKQWKGAPDEGAAG